MEPEVVTVLFVGDGQCGKTTFLSFVLPRATLSTHPTLLP